MAAVLRGFHVTGLRENDMSTFQYYLHDLIAGIPVPGC